MDARPHRVRGQVAGRGDLLVAKARDLAHQEYVAVQRSERCQRLVHSRADILRRGPPPIAGQRQGRLVPQATPVKVQREVPGDPEQPAGQVAIVVGGNPSPAQPQEDLLGQIACRFGLPNSPAEIPEQPLMVRDEQLFGVGGT